MNIGIVTTWFERGAAYVSLQYQEALVKAGHNVFILARGGELSEVSDTKWNRSNVTRVKSHDFPISTYITDKELKAWILNNQIELIIFNEQRWLKSVVISKQMNVIVGAYIDYYTEETIKLHDIYDFVLCNTKRHMSAFHEHKNPIYIPWGTEVELFDVKEKREKSEKLRFYTSVGMNPYRKGFDLLLEAFVIACEEDVFSKNSKLIVHSQIELDKFYADNIYTLNTIQNLRERNILEEYVETVTAPGLYHKGDIYVYPSRLDGIGLTLAEALSAGMPVIIPNEPPMNEFVPEKSDFAYLVDVEKYYARSDGYYWPQNEININLLAKALLDTLNEHEKYSIKSNNARNHAIQKLNWSKNSEKLSIELKKIKKEKIDQKTVSEIEYYYNKKLPYLYNFDVFYRILYKIKPLIVKMLKRK